MRRSRDVIKRQQLRIVEILFGRLDVTNICLHHLAQAPTANDSQATVLIEREDGEFLTIPEAVVEAGIPRLGLGF